jgi:hypothetical protein
VFGYRIRRLVGRGDTSPDFAVVVPVCGRPAPAESGREIVRALHLQAQGQAGAPVRVLAVDPVGYRLWCAETWRPLEISHLRRGALHVCMNPAFLLGDPPLIASLIETARAGSAAMATAQSTGEAYAFAYRPAGIDVEHLWSALRLLTAGADERCETEWRHLGRVRRLAPAGSLAEHSPALTGIGGARGLRGFDAAPFVNTAIAELLTAPADREPVAGRPEAMARALERQRWTSRVPWVFNTLLNEIEYRLGRIELDGYKRRTSPDTGCRRSCHGPPSTWGARPAPPGARCRSPPTPGPGSLPRSCCRPPPASACGR